MHNEGQLTNNKYRHGGSIQLKTQTLTLDLKKLILH